MHTRRQNTRMIIGVQRAKWDRRNGIKNSLPKYVNIKSDKNSGSHLERKSDERRTARTAKLSAPRLWSTEAPKLITA